MIAKADRNREIVRLRLSDPKKYSFYKLADMFKLRAPTVHEIFHREVKKKPEHTQLM